MFKNSIIVMLTISLVALVISCQAKYADLNDVMGKMTVASEALVTSMDKATDAKGVAAAITAYTESLKTLQDKFKAAMDKYPELKDVKDPPKALKDNIDKLTALGDKLMSAMAKIQTFAEDADVKAAVAKMGELSQ